MLHHDSNLVIHCEVELLNPLDIDNEKSLNIASLDFGALLKSGHLADVVMLVEGKKLAAHKCFLSARSPVFAAMFLHDTKENQQSQIEITDVDTDVLQEVLRFIYTSKAENLELLALDLMIAAEKVWTLQ